MQQLDSATRDGATLQQVHRYEADFWRIVRERRSIRRYTGEPIAQELIERLLEAARWAPSAHNCQPWRFCVVLQAEERAALAAAMVQPWRADLAAGGLDPASIEARAVISRNRVQGAAALVVASLCMDDMDLYPDARRQAAERIMGVQSVALACQNILLAAHAAGLGACWMCAPLFAPQVVRDVLRLPDSWEPQALITLGHPAEIKSKERAPLESRVVWR